MQAVNAVAPEASAAATSRANGGNGQRRIIEVETKPLLSSISHTYRNGRLKFLVGVLIKTHISHGVERFVEWAPSKRPTGTP